MAVLPTGIGAAAGGGYNIERSLRFNSADSAYLNRTPGSAGNRKTWTWSGWVKRGDTANNSGSGASTELTIFGSGTNVNAGNGVCSLGITGGVNFQVWQYLAGTVWNVVTTQVFRDYSAWYHILIAVDTTQATSSNRVKMYVNGVQVTAFGTASYPSQNYDTGINSTDAHNIGRRPDGQNYWGGYLTENYLIDGQALTPSSFGETDSATGVWKPKAFSGTYGTNGFYLKFADNSGTTSTTLGKDSSGNGNNWTPNNFSVTAGAGNDSLVDSPTSYGTDTGVGGTVRGNYCIMNPVNKGSTVTLSNGNLDQVTASGGWNSARASIAVASGKWYWEVTITGTTQLVMHGVDDNAYNVTTNPSSAYVGAYTNSWGVYASNGQKRNNTGSGTAYGSAFAQNDVMMVAMDMDSGKIWWGKNGTWFASGDPVAGTNAGYTNLSGYTLNPATSGFDTTDTCTHNFGQRAFAYTAPSGFKALCTQNLPTPTIGATSTTQADNYFNVVARTFTAATASITGLGFSPDWLWFKRRNAAASHSLYDRLRGTNARLLTNGPNEEITTTSAELTSFDSDGFTVGSDPGSISINSANGDTGVVWCWKANGAGSSNTAGTITSTVSANTTSGFSIVTYTGTGANATVGHGLGVTPAMYIVKRRTGGIGNWGVWHTSLSNTTTAYLLIDSTAGQSTSTSIWGSTAATSTTIGIGTSITTNDSGSTYVAYCFAAVAGYSAFGSYTGNGSADGPFVYLGFRPRYVLIKRTDTTNNWFVSDSSIAPYNLVPMGSSHGLTTLVQTLVVEPTSTPLLPSHLSNTPSHDRSNKCFY